MALMQQSHRVAVPAAHCVLPQHVLLPPRLHCRLRRTVCLSAETEKLQATQAPLDLEDSQQEGLQCIATGMGDVQCLLDDEGPPSAMRQSPAPPAPQTQSEYLLQALLMVSPFAFWGTSMVVMKGLMVTVPPLLMGAFRLLPAGLLLVGWAASQGRPQPSTWKAWAWVAAFGLVDGAAFQGFLAEGLQRTPAGLGSVIIDSQPLTVAVLAAWLFGEQLGAVGVAGLLMGVCGLLLLELPEQYLHLATQGILNPGAVSESAQGLISGAITSGGTQAASALQGPATAVLGSGAGSDAAVTLHSGLAASEVWQVVSAPVLLVLGSPSAWLASGEFWMLAAAQAMAVGTVMVRYVTKHADPVMATGWHMVLGGLVLSAAAIIDDPQAITQAVQGLGPEDLAAAAYISLLGGAASYGIFFYLASSQGSLTRLSSLTFLTPVFAAVTGYFVLGEVLTAPQLLGGAVTLTSVLLITSSKGEAQPQKQEQQ